LRSIWKINLIYKHTRHEKEKINTDKLNGKVITDKTRKGYSYENIQLC